MKTNHRRGFKGNKPKDQAMWGDGRISILADRIIGASIGNDFSNGHRGMASAKAGAKKFIRSRVRFHEQAATKRMMKELSDAN